MVIQSGWRRPAAGFTLYELLITLGIASILGVLASGAYGMLTRERVIAEVNRFVTELHLARTEAIIRRQQITFCPARNGRHCDTGTDAALWNDGGLIFVDTNDNGELDPDETLLRTHTASGSHLRIKTSVFRPRVVYRSNGMAGGNPITFTVCDTSNPLFVRYVIVSNVGRARVSVKPPDGKSDEVLERCV